MFDMRQCNLLLHLTFIINIFFILFLALFIKSFYQESRFMLIHFSLKLFLVNSINPMLDSSKSSSMPKHQQHLQLLFKEVVAHLKLINYLFSFICIVFITKCFIQCIFIYARHISFHFYFYLMFQVLCFFYFYSLCFKSISDSIKFSFLLNLFFYFYILLPIFLSFFSIFAIIFCTI